MGQRHALINEVLTFENNFFIDSSNTSLWRTNQTTEGLVNQQSNIYEDYLTLTFTPKLTGNYEIGVDFIRSHNTNSDNFRANIDITGGITENIKVLDYESREIGGSGEVLNVLSGGSIVGNINSGTDVRIPASKKVVRELTEGVSYTVKLEWNCQSGNDEGAIYRGLITVKILNI